ncbi:DUF6183 family protein [Streptomyces sp. NPDC052000]|uniref:DUF6183 family protein n=1 Tax=Streptomyces sp. NPDC052000 TaxID=3155676 RepID=UPI00344E59E1
MATTAGPENVPQALRLVSSAEVTSRKLDRYTASLLASSHEAVDLAAAFTGRASEELRACLVHELVLRAVVVREAPEWHRRSRVGRRRRIGVITRWAGCP